MELSSVFVPPFALALQQPILRRETQIRKLPDRKKRYVFVDIINHGSQYAKLIPCLSLPSANISVRTNMRTVETQANRTLALCPAELYHRPSIQAQQVACSLEPIKDDA